MQLNNYFFGPCHGCISIKFYCHHAAVKRAQWQRILYPMHVFFFSPVIPIQYVKTHSKSSLHRKKRYFCRHLTLFLSRIRDVAWITKFKNARYACKSRGDSRVFYQLYLQQSFNLSSAITYNNWYQLHVFLYF